MGDVTRLATKAKRSQQLQTLHQKHRLSVALQQCINASLVCRSLTVM
ncbi:MAG: hypothetical protein KME50_18255 [Nostoc desertorum CM1-VF14]|nr:hypothetical protein [Nostoc desertorum CM1-VF14]